MIPNTYNDAAFTMSYSYGSADKEYVFSCRGRPFAALVSTNLPTPSSSLLDYALIRQLGLKMTDIQCRKFYYAGNKMRILGRVSTAVQCVQNGKICGNFHIKGLVVSDLYSLLDTHCVAGVRMQEKIATLSGPGQDIHDEDEESDEDEFNTSLEDYYPQASPAPAQKPLASPAPALMSTASPAPALMSSTSSAPVKMSPATPAPVQKPPSNPALVVGPNTVKSRMPFTPFNTVIPPGIIGPGPANLYAIGDSGGYDHWRKYAEGDLIDQSRIDGVPRVVNLTGNYLALGGNRHNGDMLRVGDWSKLEDPAEHQARQVVLANIRRANPDRACVLCFYHLASKHSCSLQTKEEIVNHCKDCCRELTQP